MSRNPVTDNERLVGAVENVGAAVVEVLTGLSERVDALTQLQTISTDAIEAALSGLLECPGAKLTLWIASDGKSMAQVLEPVEGQVYVCAGWSASGSGLFAGIDSIMQLLACKLQSKAVFPSDEIPF